MQLLSRRIKVDIIVISLFGNIILVEFQLEKKKYMSYVCISDLCYDPDLKLGISDPNLAALHWISLISIRLTGHSLFFLIKIQRGKVLNQTR